MAGRLNQGLVNWLGKAFRTFFPLISVQYPVYKIPEAVLDIGDTNVSKTISFLKELSSIEENDIEQMNAV